MEESIYFLEHCSSASRAGFRLFRRNKTAEIVNGRFRFSCVAFRKKAVETKDGFFSRPMQKQKPGVFAALQKNRSEFPGGNNRSGLKVFFHRKNLLFADVKFDRNGRSELGHKFRAC